MDEEIELSGSLVKCSFLDPWWMERQWLLPGSCRFVQVSSEPHQQSRIRSPQGMRATHNLIENERSQTSQHCGVLLYGVLEKSEVWDPCKSVSCSDHGVT